MSVTSHESVWANGVTHHFILNLEMVDQLLVETPLPLETEVAVWKGYVVKHNYIN